MKNKLVQLPGRNLVKNNDMVNRHDSAKKKSCNKKKSNKGLSYLLLHAIDSVDAPAKRSNNQ